MFFMTKSTSAPLSSNFVKHCFAGKVVTSKKKPKTTTFTLVRTFCHHHPWLTFLQIVILGFAGVGAVFLAVLVAVKMRWTNVNGDIDQYDQDFHTIQAKSPISSRRVLGAATSSAQITPNLNILPTATVSALVQAQQKLSDLSQQVSAQTELIEQQKQTLCALSLLVTNYPDNVKNILTKYKQNPYSPILTKMIFAVTTSLDFDQTNWQQQVTACQENFDANQINEETLTAQSQTDTTNAFVWQDQERWPILQEAILKDKDIIIQAAQLADADPRLIVACLAGEQLRLFNSQRELFKPFFSPMKILANSDTISLGTMGIKPDTGKQIESHLQDKNSPYYLGEKYAHLLDFKSNDHEGERYARFTDDDNQFYSYLYAALYLEQFKTQWRQSGYPIDDRLEIVTTLYNVGFPQSEPNADPQVGGSTITLEGKTYSFGRLAYEFYYSGALADDFPLKI